MDEATEIVMSKIQSLDPDNASKIMGYILIHDQGEQEMKKLAFGPETLLLSYMNQAKTRLGLISNTPFPHTSPRILVPNNGFHHLGSNPSSPASGFQRSSPRPISYASVLNGSNAGLINGSGSSSLNFYGENEFLSGGGGRGGLHPHHQVQEFFDDPDPIMSPSGKSDSLVFPYDEDIHLHNPHNPFHRRSCSVNDASFLSNLEEINGGFGWRPCMYFAKGFCKNGSNCKFSHSDGIGGEGIEMGGSPSNTGSVFDEFLRMKAIQQHRFALMGSGGHNPFAYNKCMNFNENPRNDFSSMGLNGGANSSSRQIYLTFPADSTFREEDVSGYFSIFGPVQDVRIPYQQKRMFGFVTFLYPETVKLILAKGNPHFVCDSRVLVKPYKEKGKITDKKQHMESGDYSACLSPSGIESGDHFDPPFGSRMLLNTQEMMIRRKLEQEAELQHALELQSRRMMNLQLMDMKNQHFLRNLPAGIPISSPRQSLFLMNQNLVPSDFVNQEVFEEFDGGEEGAKSPNITIDEKLVMERTEPSSNNDNSVNNHGNSNDSEIPESFEHILPDNLFASPTKLAAERQSIFFQAFGSTDDSIAANTSSNNTSALPGNSRLGMASFKPCYFQMPSH